MEVVFQHTTMKRPKKDVLILDLDVFIIIHDGRILGKIISQPTFGCFVPDEPLLEFLLENDPRIQKHIDWEELAGNKPVICCKESQWRRIFETLELEDGNEHTDSDTTASQPLAV